MEPIVEKQLSEALTSLLEKTNVNEHFSIPKPLDYQSFLSSKILLVFAIKEGIPYAIFSLIQQASPFSLQDWSDFLNISYKSLQRYKAQQTHFKSIYTEKIFELAEVMQVGTEVFGSLDKLKQWLITENYALGSLKPIELLRDSYGKELVLNELVRIDDGILV